MSSFIEFLTIVARSLSRGVIPGSFTIVYKKEKQKQKYLIIKTKSSGNVTFPGGSISWNENFEDAAKRELYEETGLRVDKLIEIPITHKFMYRQLFLKPKSEQHVFVFYLRGNNMGGLHSRESEWFKWVSASKVERLLTHKALSKTFIESLKYIK